MLERKPSTDSAANFFQFELRVADTDTRITVHLSENASVHDLLVDAQRALASLDEKLDARDMYILDKYNRRMDPVRFLI